MSRAYGPLADRPDRAVVGLEVSHESADLHVTGAALYTEDLTGRTLGTLHAWPVPAPHAHARVNNLRVAAAYEVPGVVRVLTADDVPGVNNAGEKHDEPLFPSEVMYYGHPVCWVLGETLEAARQGAARVEADYEPLLALISVHDAIEADSYQGHHRTVSRGDAAAALKAAAYRFSGELEIGGQEHFYLETQAALALVDENGQIFVQSSTQHPSRPRTSWPTCWACRPTRSPSSACAWGRLRRQGVPAARAGRHRGARGHAHRAPGQPAAEPQPGHPDDRQAAPVLRHLGSGLRRR